jgi:hypothetical protein
LTEHINKYLEEQNRYWPGMMSGYPPPSREEIIWRDDLKKIQDEICVLGDSLVDRLAETGENTELLFLAIDCVSDDAVKSTEAGKQWSSTERKLKAVASKLRATFGSAATFSQLRAAAHDARIVAELIQTTLSMGADGHTGAWFGLVVARLQRCVLAVDLANVTSITLANVVQRLCDRVREISQTLKSDGYEATQEDVDLFNHARTSILQFLEAGPTPPTTAATFDETVTPKPSEAVTSDTASDSQPSKPRWNALAIGCETIAKWHRFKKIKGEWQHQGRMRGIAKGRQAKLMKAFAEGGGFLSKDDALKLERANYSPGDVDKLMALINPELAKLRAAIRDASKVKDTTANPLPFDDLAKGWRAEIEIGFAVQDDGKHIGGENRLRFKTQSQLTREEAVDR